MELRSFDPSNKSKTKQKTPPTNLQWLFEVVCMYEIYHRFKWANFTIDLNRRILQDLQ